MVAVEETTTTPATEVVGESQPRNAGEDKNGASAPPAAEMQSSRVRLRQKTPLTARNGNAAAARPPIPTGDAVAALQRSMGALYEAPGDLEDNNEEIRRLDSQLDHLNDYMDKVEERLRQHNEKMTKVLNEQRAEREKRRQSFHERMQANRAEDDDFHAQIAALLNQVNVSRQRSSVIDLNTTTAQ